MKYYKLMLSNDNSNKNDIICFSEENFEQKYGIRHYDLSESKYI